MIPNAHSNSILSLKMFKMFNPNERRSEEILASGGKDKQLKLWNITHLISGINADISQNEGDQPHARNLSEISLSHYSQVNTFSQLNDHMLMTGTSDGKI